MKRLLSLCVPVVICLVSFGCGSGSKVTGKVTFPDETPLTIGKVMFTDSSISAFGTIDKNGNYSMGLLKDGQGIPPGTYKVYITEAMVDGDASLARKDEDGNMVIPKVPAVALKFMSADASGLTCEVKGKTTFDIKVEKLPSGYNPHPTQEAHGKWD